MRYILHIPPPIPHINQAPTGNVGGFPKHDSRLFRPAPPPSSYSSLVWQNMFTSSHRWLRSRVLPHVLRIRLCWSHLSRLLRLPREGVVRRRRRLGFLYKVAGTTTTAVACGCGRGSERERPEHRKHLQMYVCTYVRTACSKPVATDKQTRRKNKNGLGWFAAIRERAKSGRYLGIMTPAATMYLLTAGCISEGVVFANCSAKLCSLTRAQHRCYSSSTSTALARQYPLLGAKSEGHTYKARDYAAHLCNNVQRTMRCMPTRYKRFPRRCMHGAYTWFARDNTRALRLCPVLV